MVSKEAQSDTHTVTEAGLYRRMLADPRLRGARAVPVPARRGVRHDASLLGSGGSGGGLRERLARRRSRRLHLSRPRPPARAMGAEPEALLAELLGRSTGDQRRPGRLDEHRRPGPRPDRLLRDRRRQHRRGHGRGARVTRHRRDRSRVLRRRRDEPGVLLRVPQLRQGAGPARRVRLREQRLRRVHADGGGDGRPDRRARGRRWDCRRPRSTAWTSGLSATWRSP